MNETWLNKNLCSIEEKVRIELGPQFIELECNDANLKDEVTAPHYRVGKIDALGRIIMPERVAGLALNGRQSIAEGEMMTCVDWRCKHKPKIWKIYQFQPKLDDDGEPMFDAAKKAVGTFIKVGEEERKADALTIARTLAGEM